MAALPAKRGLFLECKPHFPPWHMPAHVDREREHGTRWNTGPAGQSKERNCLILLFGPLLVLKHIGMASAELIVGGGAFAWFRVRCGASFVSLTSHLGGERTGMYAPRLFCISTLLMLYLQQTGQVTEVVPLASGDGTQQRAATETSGSTA